MTTEPSSDFELKIVSGIRCAAIHASKKSPRLSRRKMENRNETGIQRLSVITVDPTPFKVRPIGKNLAPLADCHPGGLIDFS